MLDRTRVWCGRFETYWEKPSFLNNLTAGDKSKSLIFLNCSESFLRARMAAQPRDRRGTSGKAELFRTPNGGAGELRQSRERQARRLSYGLCRSAHRTAELENCGKPLDRLNSTGRRVDPYVPLIPLVLSGRAHLPQQLLRQFTPRICFR